MFDNNYLSYLAALALAAIWSACPLLALHAAFRRNWERVSTISAVFVILCPKVFMHLYHHYEGIGWAPL